jgi:hypothetical protein
MDWRWEESSRAFLLRQPVYWMGHAGRQIESVYIGYKKDPPKILFNKQTDVHYINKLIVCKRRCQRVNTANYHSGEQAGKYKLQAKGPTIDSAMQLSARSCYRKTRILVDEMDKRCPILQKLPKDEW